MCAAEDGWVGHGSSAGASRGAITGFLPPEKNSPKRITYSSTVTSYAYDSSIFEITSGIGMMSTSSWGRERHTRLPVSGFHDEMRLLKLPHPPPASTRRSMYDVWYTHIYIFLIIFVAGFDCSAIYHSHPPFLLLCPGHVCVCACV